MNNNQKSNPKEAPTPAVKPRPHDQKKVNPTVVVDTKSQITPASMTPSRGQKTDDTSDSKPQSGPTSGTPARGRKTDPTVVVDAKARPAPALGTLLSSQKIDPRVVVDSKAQPKLAIKPPLHDQKINPTVVDTEAQPLAHNLRANINHPYIHITPSHKQITTPLISKHGFKYKTCICWTIGLIFLILLILGAIVGIIFLIFHPKIPNYSVDSLSISDLRLNLDLSLYAKFDVKITATNPNKKIGIYYRKGSKLSVWYSNSKLCQGSLPKFYQGHQNTTKIDVALTGQNQYGSTLMAALQEQQQTGRIPLDLKVDVPVNIELGKLKLRKIRILGTCVLTVDSLSANSFITIKASTCKYRAKL